MLLRRCIQLANEVRVLRDHNTRLWRLNAEQVEDMAALAKRLSEMQAGFDLLALHVPQDRRRDALDMVRQWREIEQLEETEAER